jgi:hypothetical protein
MLQINEIIEQLLRDNGTNPEQLGIKLEIPSNTIRNNMKEGANPKFEFLMALSKHFGIKDFNFWSTGVIRDDSADCPKCKEREAEVQALREEIIDKSARLDELRRREQVHLLDHRGNNHRGKIPQGIDFSNCLS